MPEKNPSPEAAAALALVQQLRSEVAFLRSELRSTRRLALASFGVATAAITAWGAGAF